MNVMLLAAGEGSRLRPYTLTLPKPAMPFLSIPLAAHALGFLSTVGINKLVVNTYHLPRLIHSLFETLPVKWNSLHFSDEQNLLGSGGGLSKARAHFQGQGDFILMNADEVILPSESHALQRAIEFHQKSKALATLLVIEHPGVGTQFGGVWCDEQNQVLGFGKNPTSPSAKGWHFIGVQILSDKIFDFLPSEGESNILYDAVAAGISQGFPVNIFPLEKCLWFETGNPQDFLQATSACLDILNDSKNDGAQKMLQKNLKEFSQEAYSIDVNNDRKILKFKSSQVSNQSTLEGVIVLGKNSKVAEGCHLENCIVNNDITVPENTQGHDVIYL